MARRALTDQSGLSQGKLSIEWKTNQFSSVNGEGDLDWESRRICVCLIT
jgi:hypothetical protein